ncbi:MAG: efflux RND transporter periplasmic adaptor subunit, partial [Muribaculaceae bacterium]
LAMASSCRKEMPTMSAALYPTMTIATDSCTVNREYSATLKGVQSVEVRPQVSGTITEICVDEGAHVSKGQVMFVIDQVPYRAALENATAQVSSARARLANAQLTLTSKQQLYQQGIVSEFEVEQAQLNVNELQAELNTALAAETTARNNLSYTTVTSPADGYIGMIPYRVGALVSQTITQPLTTVADNSSVQAYFSISEAEMQKLITDYGSLTGAISAMPRPQLKLADGSQYAETGRIDAISGNVDSATGAVTLRATFANPDRVLRDGGSATLILPYSFSDAIVIPQEATYQLQNKYFVYTVVDSKTKSREITISTYDDGHNYIVTSGLAVGDVIISEGAGLLRDGIEVTL